MGKVKVELCLGSSCFARGNSEGLAALEAYLEQHHLEDQVDLVGHLCVNACSEGPNVTIDGTTYHHVDSAALIDLLEKALAKQGGAT